MQQRLAIMETPEASPYHVMRMRRRSMRGIYKAQAKMSKTERRKNRERTEPLVRPRLALEVAAVQEIRHGDLEAQRVPPRKEVGIGTTSSS